MTVLVTTFLLSALLCGGYLRFARVRRFLDAPNERSSHSHPTPHGGGAAVLLAFIAGPLLAAQCYNSWDESFVVLAVAALLLMIVGVIDDLRGLSVRVRMALYSLVCLWVADTLLQSIFIDSGASRLVLGLLVALVMLWSLNLYNFMDGIDGIATGEALCVLTYATMITLYFALGSVAYPVILLLACCAGFLVINWPQARAFMGDGGSGFLGLTFGVFVVTETMLPIWSWLILLGWFVTDASLTITLRLFRKQKIEQAYSEHAYQHLNRAAGTVKTLLLVFAINTVWLLPLAALAAIFKDWGFGLLILAYLPLIIVQYCCGAGQTTRKLTLRKQT